MSMRYSDTLENKDERNRLDNTDPEVGGFYERTRPPAENGGRRSRWLQIISICAFLISWVANGEIMQGVTSGSLGSSSAYDKPTFITWFSYNYMTLSLLVVYPYVKYHKKWTISHYLRYAWAGKLGLGKATLYCVIISYILQVLNILLIVGLECITVSLSNAVYQLQTIFTVGLSACILKDKLVLSKGVGILLSLVGVALIVVPPMFAMGDTPQSMACSFGSPVIAGIVVTIGSAAIGGAYLVSWRVFDQKRFNTELGRLEGFVDTQMTLAMIGLCNLVLGWPTIALAHWSNFEEFQWPVSHWWILSLNGFVEYLFDASCAGAIYMTSPVVVAIASPLTIPLSMIVDHMLHDLSGLDAITTWLGVGVILGGIYFLETKPSYFGQGHIGPSETDITDKEALLVANSNEKDREVFVALNY